MVEPLALTADQAIALALFTTEALTNALEHAFIDGATGAVTVTLERRGEDARLLLAKMEHCGQIVVGENARQRAADSFHADLFAAAMGQRVA